MTNLQEIWKAGKIVPDAWTGYAGGISSGLDAPKKLATNRPVKGYAELRPQTRFEDTVGVIVELKPSLRKELTPIRYNEEFFRKNLRLAEYVRDTLGLGLKDTPEHISDIVSGAASYRTEKELVSRKPIQFKENVQKIRVFLTPDSLNTFISSGPKESFGTFARSALRLPEWNTLPEPGERKMRRPSAKRLAFVATAATTHIARQFKGIPLDVYYGEPQHKPRLLFSTEGNVPRIRKEAFPLFLPKLKRAKWGVFNKESPFGTPYSQTLTKPEAEQKLKLFENELNEPFEVRRLTKADWRQPIYL